MFFIRKKSIDQINANRVSFNLLNKQNVIKLLSVKEKGKKIHAYYRFQASFFILFYFILFFFIFYFYLDKSKSVNKFCFKKIKLKPLNNSVEKNEWRFTIKTELF